MFSFMDNSENIGFTFKGTFLLAFSVVYGSRVFVLPRVCIN